MPLARTAVYGTIKNEKNCSSFTLAINYILDEKNYFFGYLKKKFKSIFDLTTGFGE